jgi:hypothetical protein
MLGILGILEMRTVLLDLVGFGLISYLVAFGRFDWLWSSLVVTLGWVIMGQVACRNICSDLVGLSDFASFYRNVFELDFIESTRPNVL